jgi:hypothetical protein
VVLGATGSRYMADNTSAAIIEASDIAIVFILLFIPKGNNLNSRPTIKCGSVSCLHFLEYALYSTGKFLRTSGTPQTIALQIEARAPPLPQRAIVDKTIAPKAPIIEDAVRHMSSRIAHDAISCPFAQYVVCHAHLIST